MAEACRTVVVAGCREGIRLAIKDFDAFCSENHLPADTLWPFQVTLDEILSNVVRHAYAGKGQDRQIEVRFALQGGILELTVADDAAPFDPLMHGDPDTSLPLDERPLGGLGLLIVKRLMDRVEYERRGDRNRLTCWRRVGA
jgi:serine/threonine-protein kinase RsbW